MWEKTGHKSLISIESWPKADKKKINPVFEAQEKALENTIQDINNILKLVKQTPHTVYIYTIPSELTLYNSNTINKKTGINIKIFAVNDKNKHDPQNKAKKAKPGKPGIYIE